MKQAVVQGGKVVKIGDWVCFKDDGEQLGRIYDIKRTNRGMMLCLENPDRFSGAYIGGDQYTIQSPGACWVE